MGRQHVFGVFFSPCIHESAFGLLSLHTSLEGATAAMEKARKKELRMYKSALPDWVQFKVQEVEVRND